MHMCIVHAHANAHVPCMHHRVCPTHAMHMPCAPPSVSPEQECQGVGEVLEKQRQQPGHGGLNLSVARDMARVEDYDRAAT